MDAVNTNTNIKIDGTTDALDLFYNKYKQPVQGEYIEDQNRTCGYWTDENGEDRLIRMAVGLNRICYIPVTAGDIIFINELEGLVNNGNGNAPYNSCIWYLTDGINIPTTKDTTSSKVLVKGQTAGQSYLSIKDTYIVVPEGATYFVYNYCVDSVQNIEIISSDLISIEASRSGVKLNGSHTIGTKGYRMLTIDWQDSDGSWYSETAKDKKGQKIKITLDDKDFTPKATEAYAVGDSVCYDGQSVHIYNELVIESMEANADGNTEVVLLLSENSMYVDVSYLNLNTTPDENMWANWFYVAGKEGATPVEWIMNALAANTSNIVNSRESSVFNRGNTVYGSLNLVGGKGNNVYSYQSFCFGSSNTVMNANVIGSNNVAYSGIVLGSKNNVCSKTAVTSVIGDMNNVKGGNRNHIMASRATIEGDTQESVIIGGRNNKLLGTNAWGTGIFAGNGNSITDSTRSVIVGGYNNTINKATDSVIHGNHNVVNEGANCSMAMGQYLTVNTPYTTMVGINGASKEKDLFVVAYRPGSSGRPTDDKYRPFYVTTEGNAKVLNDLSTKTITIGNTTLTEAQVNKLLALIEA